MKPQKTISLILSLFLFSSCSFENAPPIDENENINFNPEITVLNSGNDSPVVMNYSYEITVTNDVSNLRYNGEQLSLDIELENHASEAEIGFVLVSDGQPVETSVDGKTEIVCQRKKLSISLQALIHMGKREKLLQFIL